MTADLRDLADCPTAEDLDAAKVEAAARMRSAGIHDSEQRKRARLAAELVAELKRPLVDGHPPSDLEAIAALAPRPPSYIGGRRR